MMFKHNFKNHLLPKLEQINEEGNRQYLTSSGVKYPSVTTMLGHFTSQGIMEWRRRVGVEEANRITRQASTRGTAFHKVCEKYLLNEQMEFKTPLQKQLFINTKPYLENIGEIQLIEGKLFSHHLRLAGTVDCVGDYEKKLSVIDFKSASRAKPKEYIEDYFMQCTAYAIMYEELLQIPVSQIVVIIAVEGEESQVFVEKRDNYAKKLLTQRDNYEKITGRSYSPAILPLGNNDGRRSEKPSSHLS